jgi:hypothetical protein
MSLSGLAFLFGTVSIFAGRNTIKQIDGFVMTGTAVMAGLLSGAIWLLADVTDALTAEREDSRFSPRRGRQPLA